MPDDILHIGSILQTAFDLERSDAGRHQVGHAAVETDILRRKKRLVADKDMPFGIRQVIAGAAGLRTGTAIGTAAGQVLAQIALAAVSDTKRAVNEELQAAAFRHGGADGPDLFERQLALEHQARKAERRELPRPLRRPDGRLRGSVQLHRRQVKGEQAQVLDDEDIDTRFVQVPHQPMGIRKFIPLQERVDRRMDLDPVQMRITAQPGDVGHLVPGSGPRAESRSRDINGIGTTVDGCDADLRISRGCEKLKAYLHLSWVIW